ncbi:Carboxylesterase type B, partial [Trinorchestia longiramus]
NFTEQLADGLWISFAAVVEGEKQPEAFLPRHPHQVLLEEKLPNDVPVFLTVTTDEVSIWYRGNQDELKVFQVENWISKIVKNIYSPLKLSPENLAAVIHSV